MRTVRDWVSRFREQHPDMALDVLAGGDRNFKTAAPHLQSSETDQWHPGHEMLSAWHAFLEELQMYEVTQPNFTFRRQGRRRDGRLLYLREVLDFCATNPS